MNEKDFKCMKINEEDGKHANKAWQCTTPYGPGKSFKLRVGYGRTEKEARTDLMEVIAGKKAVFPLKVVICPKCGINEVKKGNTFCSRSCSKLGNTYRSYLKD